ncbi:hypothetical protein [uncultured Methylobacterium sp.]|jgi:hypothetical protein|uniref:hypothetical protein n=1 Tax=uncultured Methylobacterium sp. TaxID=157278 RepID=UPI00262A4A35|nr:hypothetical protein [uncultured Methylobacterium sp.]
MQVAAISISPGAVAILRTTREILSDPARHTQKAVARDKFGVEVGPTDPRAVCWCFLGGMSKAGAKVDTRDPFDKMEALARVERTITLLTDGLVSSLIAVNEDTVEIPGADGETLTGHAAVLRVLDVALEV